jgi:hypothetical protein
MFRNVSEQVNRDQCLLVAKQPGLNFIAANVHRWRTGTCPMSSASLSQGRRGVIAAWETAGQVYWSTVDPQSLRLSPAICPPGDAARKHPVAIANHRGETLLVWTEGTGWGKSGEVVWQLYTDAGVPKAVKGRSAGAAWSFAAACALPDGGFVILF